MPNHHTSKALPFPEAERLGDLDSIQNDLRHCVRICDYFLDAGCMIGEGSWDKVYLDSLYISYRRVFAKGNRSKLSPDDISVCPDRLLSVHREVIDVANEHVAHPVNRMEESFVSLAVVLDDDGKLIRRGGLNRGGRGVLGPSIEQIQRLRELIDHMLTETIPQMVLSLETALLEHVSELSDEQILALPCGIPTGTRGKQHMKGRPRLQSRQQN